MLERLQKIIARAGVASRRHAEELISCGHVTVNGRVVTELGTKADHSRDHIKVSGKLLRPENERVYLLLHKPPEVVSTMSDPEGRRTLRDMLYGISERVFPVGRLEYHAAGLVFLTNDGDLTNRILKSHSLPQTYLMKLKSLLTFAEIDELSRATGAKIERLKTKDTPWYEVTLSDARRDELRNRLFQTGHPVERMKRVRIGNLELESLAPGRHRALSPAEVSALSRAASPANGSNADASPVIAKARVERPHRLYRPKPKPGAAKKLVPVAKHMESQIPVAGRTHDDRRPFANRGASTKHGALRKPRLDRKDAPRQQFGGRRSDSKPGGTRNFGAGRKDDSRRPFGGKRPGQKPGGPRNSPAGRKRDDRGHSGGRRNPGARFMPKDSR
jgi:23S rRNA pseudouridine2605 synthase